MRLWLRPRERHRGRGPRPGVQGRRRAPWTASTSTSRPGRSTASSGPTAPASRPPCSCSPRCCRRPRARARVAGHDIVRDGAAVRGVIGAALQEAALDPLLTAREHMRLQTALQGVPKAERRARGDELIERVGPDRRGRPQGARLLGRHEAPARPRARARAPPARPLPRRADHGAGSVEPRRPVGGGRPPGPRRRRDGLPHHAVPGGGRRPRRPRRHHRPRADRRRGHAGGAEGGDRAPVGRGAARRARRARGRAAVLAQLRRRRARAARRGRGAPASAGSDLAAVVRALDADGHRACRTCSSTSRRSTTSSWPRRAASSRPASEGAAGREERDEALAA